VFGLGGSELLVIALVALVLLGPERLPPLARAFARGYREFMKVRRQVDDTLTDLKKDMKLDLDEAPAVRPPVGRRVPLDQLHAVELEERERRAAEALPVAEGDDYLAIRDEGLGTRAAGTAAKSSGDALQVRPSTSNPSPYSPVPNPSTQDIGKVEDA
jgi:Tat protein translocase TatB subunit